MNMIRQQAFLIARLFPSRVPTAKEVQDAVPGITRATAYRYVRDYKRAWECAAKRA